VTMYLDYSNLNDDQPVCCCCLHPCLKLIFIYLKFTEVVKLIKKKNLINLIKNLL